MTESGRRPEGPSSGTGRPSTGGRQRPPARPGTRRVGRAAPTSAVPTSAAPASAATTLPGRGATTAAGPRRVEPDLPDDVTGAELDRSVRAQLASLAKVNAEIVAKHLVTAARLIDTDPEQAYRHAVAARERAGRVGAVREAAGLAAYRAGHYAEALSELRAARRISGDQSLMAVMADCERGLGRPERALAMTEAPEVPSLDAATRVELKIVASGARRDLGQAGRRRAGAAGPAAARRRCADRGPRDSSTPMPRPSPTPAGTTRRSPGCDMPPPRTPRVRPTPPSGSTVIDGILADVAFVEEEPEDGAEPAVDGAPHDGR